MSTIIKGSSIPVSSIKIKDGGGNYILLSASDNIIIYFVDAAKTIFSKWSMDVKAGYHTLTVEDTTTLSCKIPGSETRNVSDGPFEMQMYQEITDAEVPTDGELRYMGAVEFTDSDGTAIKFVNKVINAET